MTCFTTKHSKFGVGSLCTDVPPPEKRSGEETTSPLPIFPEGGGTSVHRLGVGGCFDLICFCSKNIFRR